MTSEAEDLKLKRIVAFACLCTVTLGAIAALDILSKLSRSRG